MRCRSQPRQGDEGTPSAKGSGGRVADVSSRLVEPHNADDAIRLGRRARTAYNWLCGQAVSWSACHLPEDCPGACETSPMRGWAASEDRYVSETAARLSSIASRIIAPPCCSPLKKRPRGWVTGLVLRPFLTPPQNAGSCCLAGQKSEAATAPELPRSAAASSFMVKLSLRGTFAVRSADSPRGPP